MKNWGKLIIVIEIFHKIIDFMEIKEKDINLYNNQFEENGFSNKTIFLSKKLRKIYHLS